MDNLKKYLMTSIKDCSTQIDECENEQVKRELIKEKETYESVLRYVDTIGISSSEQVIKNVSSNEIQKCIFLSLEDFEELIDTLTNGLQKVEYEFSVYITNSDKAEENEEYWEEDICDTLSNYYGVEVTSYHSDDCEYPGVWICYK